jgi:hypothetical protein
MPLRLDPYGSVFVVFRRPAEPVRLISLSKDGQAIFPGPMAVAKGTPTVEVMRGQDGATEFTIWESGKYAMRTAAGKTLRLEEADIPSPLEIAGPWELQFPKGLGAPPSVVLDKLISWTKHVEAGVKYFSGTATYRREIEISAHCVGKGNLLYLDLGEVKHLAEVRFNGVDLGVLWKAPFRVEISGQVKPGKNQLEVKVTNLWDNRCIGDLFLPESQRITRSNGRSWKKTDPLLASGLLGPVTIHVAGSRRLDAE